MVCPLQEIGGEVIEQAGQRRPVGAWNGEGESSVFLARGQEWGVSLEKNNNHQKSHEMSRRGEISSLFSGIPLMGG